MGPLFYFVVNRKYVATRAEQLVGPALEAEGLELVHVDFQPKGAGSLLRIYIDKPGGVNLGDCQKASRYIGVLLDVEDFIPHQYVLEVSSPGLERPLFKESDYRRFRGCEIHLQVTDKIEDRRKFTGSILDLSNGVLKLECEDRTFEIPLVKVRKARLVYRSS